MAFNASFSRESVPWMRFAAILFFFVTSFFAVQWKDGHFNSPDETANAFFIRQYAREGTLRVTEPDNALAEDLLHPRAIAIARHDLVPGSFLGMILLYGWIAKIFGFWIVRFLTPLIATIASFFFYKLVRLFFDERVARWSFFLLLIHPAWIYYTARSMFPNVLFLSLLIIGLYFFVTCYMLHVTWRRVFIAALLIGSALAVRTAEAGWVFGSLCLLWFFYRKNVRWWHVLLFVLGMSIPFFFIFHQNVQLYGNLFYNGYSQIDSDALPSVFAWHFQSRILSTIFSLLLPFGIKPFVLLRNAYNYLIWFFWWLAVPMVLGVAVFLRKKLTTYNLQLTTFYLFITLWLLLYYGSWVFRDTTLTGPTLGTSYVRYWLPIFIFGIPFVAFVLSHQQRFSTRTASLVIIVFLSSWSVFWNNGESLFAMRKTAFEAHRVSTAVLSRVASNAVIVTERSDKLFFPERRVIFHDALDQKKIDRVLALLLTRVPVYYFTELAKHDIDFMNERRLAQYGVAWGDGEEIVGQRLYRLENVK